MTTETGTAAPEFASVPASEQAGIPQLDFSAFPNQVFWLVVCLVILYQIMSRVALPRIEGILEHRKKLIQADLMDAEALNDEAVELRARNIERLDEARASAESITADARSTIREIKETALADASERIDAHTSEAEVRIDEIRRISKDSIAEIAHVAALEIVSKMIPGRDSAVKVSSAIKARSE